MSDTYEQLTRKQLLEQHQEKPEESIEITDKRLYREMTGDAGDHNAMLEKLDQQFATLGEIRKTGVPSNLEPAQQNDTRYRHVGHFDKKARKSAAKEAQSLTKKAKDLNVQMKNMPKDALTIPYDIQMTKYMQQAELESLKANGYKENSPEYSRVQLKYLRHSEVIMEKSLQDQDMSGEQIEAVSKSLVQVQGKIDALLDVERVHELQQNNYKSEAERVMGQGELSEKEADALLKRSLKVAKSSQIDLLKMSVFSPKLLNVNPKQMEKFIKENKVVEEEKEKKKEKEKKTSEKDVPKILSNPSPDDYPNESNNETALIDKILAALKEHKEECGGSPHYNGEEPFLKKSSKKICGHPWAAFKDWVRKYTYKEPKNQTKEDKKDEANTASDQNAIAQALGAKKQHNVFVRGTVKLLAHMAGYYKEEKKIAKANNSDYVGPETTYEVASLQLLTMRAMAQKKKTITKLFQEADKSYDGKYKKEIAKDCQEFINGSAALLCHFDDNRPSDVLYTFKSYFELLEFGFKQAKEEKNLDEFFKAIDGVCFGDRHKNLQLYCTAHAPKEKRNVPKDGHVYVELENNIPQIGSASVTYMEMAGRWLSSLEEEKSLAKCKGGYREYPAFEELLPCFRYEMLGHSFTPNNDSGYPIEGDPVEVTEEMLTSKDFKRYLAENYMIYDKETWDEMPELYEMADLACEEYEAEQEELREEAEEKKKEEEADHQ